MRHVSRLAPASGLHVCGSTAGRRRWAISTFLHRCIFLAPGTTNMSFATRTDQRSAMGCSVPRPMSGAYEVSTSVPVEYAPWRDCADTVAPEGSLCVGRMWSALGVPESSQQTRWSAFEAYPTKMLFEVSQDRRSLWRRL
jgi:hypothetical protein